MRRIDKMMGLLNSPILPRLVVGIVYLLYSVQIASAEEELVLASQGVYTNEQAIAGAVLFNQHCLACHSDEVGKRGGHGPAPSLLADDFRYRWLDSAIADLYDAIRQTMPEGAPNSLSEQQYADVTAYLLALNGYPSGQRLLTADRYEQMLEMYVD